MRLLLPDVKGGRFTVVTVSCVAVCVATPVQAVLDHYADVYGLDSHPSRPFVYASSSRDTTLRFWTLHGEADLLKVRCRWDTVSRER